MKIECTIRRANGAVSTVSVKFLPRHAPPAAGAMHHSGVIGLTGQERLWKTGIESAVNEIQWDFGGGATPNTAHGSQAVPTVLGAPGRYTANYSIRNDWGCSGPQRTSYWVAPTWSTHHLSPGYTQYATMLLFNNRIRVLFRQDDEYRYGQALVAEPKSALDWRFSELPMPELHASIMEMGVHDGHLLVVGWYPLGGSGVVPYWRASSQAPIGPDDWDVGGIPESDGLEVLDLVIEQERVGLLLRSYDGLHLWWDRTSTLSDWHSSEIAAEVHQYRFYSNLLLLSDTGPAVVGFDLRPEEPSGLTYRTTGWDTPDAWSVHRILDVDPVSDATERHAACIYQGRPLVLGGLDEWSSALLWSSVPCPTGTADWERLVTCHELSPKAFAPLATIDVSGDRLVMNGVDVRRDFGNGIHGQSRGGLSIEGDPSDLTHWTPFLSPSGSDYEVIRATVLTDDGVGLLTSLGGGLFFGMLRSENP